MTHDVNRWPYEPCTSYDVRGITTTTLPICLSIINDWGMNDQMQHSS